MIADDAIADARLRVRDGDPYVHIFSIDTETLRPAHLNLSFVPTGRQLHVPVWSDDLIRRNRDRLHRAFVNKQQPGFTAFSTIDARRYLGPSLETSRLSEWFVLDFIPGNLVKEMVYPL